jgi:3-oxoacyl-[acyl-carrier protein] reductase
MAQKSALVTGASRGIGRGIALELARAGYRVAINYAGNAEAAAEALKLVQEGGGRGSRAPRQRDGREFRPHRHFGE